MGRLITKYFTAAEGKKTFLLMCKAGVNFLQIISPIRHFLLIHHPSSFPARFGALREVA